MDEIDDSDVPPTGAVFTYGLSRFADNEPGKFWVRNDKVVQVACGEEHSVLITESGRVFSFGKNEWGQLGVGRNMVVHNKPACVKSLKAKGEKVRLVACGRNHTLLATESGSLYGMGNNVEKQISSEVGDTVPEPHLIHSGQDFMALAAGGEMSAALLSSGQVLTWGSNAEGQCGIGDDDAGLDPVTEPTRVSLPGRVVSLSCGYYHTAAVLDDGRLFAWGEADGGKLGLIHVTSSQLEPQEVPVVEPMRSVSCGNNHTVAVAASGRLYVWGDGPSGQLGLGQEWDHVAEPTRVKFDSPEICISTAVAGESHTIALSEDGRVFVFGDDRHGKLGLPSAGPAGDTRAVWLPTELERFRNARLAAYVADIGGCHTVLLALPDPNAPPASPRSPLPQNSEFELRTESSEQPSEATPRPHARRRTRGENSNGLPPSLPPLRRSNLNGREEDRPNGEFDDMLLDDDSEEEAKRVTPPRPTQRSSRSLKSVTPSTRGSDVNGANSLLDDSRTPSSRQFSLRTDDDDDDDETKTRRRAKPGIFNKGAFDAEDEEEVSPEPIEPKPMRGQASSSVEDSSKDESRLPIDEYSPAPNEEKVKVGCGGRKSSSAVATTASGDDSKKSKSCIML